MERLRLCGREHEGKEMISGTYTSAWRGGRVLATLLDYHIELGDFVFLKKKVQSLNLAKKMQGTVGDALTL